MRVIGYLESSLWTMRALEFGSMMRVAYAHAQELDALLDRKEAPQTMLGKSGERLQGTRYIQVRDGVAVLDVNGIIAKRMSMFDELCGPGGTSTELAYRDFTNALQNPNVESIVLSIDSPGGEAFGINEFAQAIYEARGKKPIKAYIGGLGCSGAYWIASAADEVVIDKSAFAGSIGVVTAWMDDKKFYEMLGIRREVVVSSNAPFKRLDFDNEDHRAELQRELDSLESVFIKAVARNRKVTVDQVKKDFNKGGVLAGADAVKAGMADSVGSLEGVIKSLSKKGKTIASFSSASQGPANVGAKTEEKERDMSLKEKLKAFFASEEVKPLLEDGKEYHLLEKTADREESEPVKTADPKPVDGEPAKGEGQSEAKDEKEPKPETDEPKKDGSEVEALRREIAVAKAEAFVDAEVVAGRILPGEKAKAVSELTEAAIDDHMRPLSFSRFDSIKARYQGRKEHGLNKERVDSNANEIFVLKLGEGEKTKMRKDAEAQVDAYVAQVTPRAGKLEAVK